MTDATTLEALAVRVEAGEAGREIDALVLCAVVEGRPQFDLTAGPDWMVVSETQRVRPAKYTTSLDAVAALAERVLPGHYTEVSGPRKYLNIPTPVPNYWKCVLSSGQHGFSGVDWIAWAPTECAARLAAILRAKAKDTQ